MKTTISYDHFNQILRDLLGTSSPTKRATFLREWLIQYDYDMVAVQSILDLLDVQREAKANQGAAGGRSDKKAKAQNNAIIELVGEIRTLMMAPPVATPPRVRATKTGESYKRPIWVKKCAGVGCDECGEEIDGCAFRWKRNGVYSSWHPTCIPNEDRTTFESIREYREHFKLNDKPTLRLVKGQDVEDDVA